MKLKNFFMNLLLPKNGENTFSSNSDPACVCIDQGRYVPLSKISTLSDASLVAAKGTWSQGDFVLLREKWRSGFPKFRVNSVLCEVDFGDVKLDSSCDFIDFKELFHFCVNLSNVILPDATEFEGRVTFRATFKGCGKLKEIQNLSTYRHITDLCGSFCYCTLLSGVELFSDPFPHVDSETFQRINRNIRVSLPPVEVYYSHRYLLGFGTFLFPPRNKQSVLTSEICLIHKYDLNLHSRV